MIVSLIVLYMLLNMMLFASTTDGMMARMGLFNRGVFGQAWMIVNSWYYILKVKIKR